MEKDESTRTGGNVKGDEYFDIVDARDEVLGRALRREVHARGLWHRAVHVFVTDGAGRIFLQKRSMRKDLSPGCWDASCTGHVDSGEAYDTAAVRELGEELGLFGVHPVRWFRVEACAETGWEFVWVYRLRHEGPFALAAEEIETGAWFAPAEVTEAMSARPRDFTPAFRLVWPLSVAAAK
jgi:isopentenyl-diphosphate delta-isomerase type 1